MFKHFFSKLGHRFLAGGDWNAKHCQWGSRLITTRGKELNNCINNKKYNILTTREPTYWPTDKNKLPDLLDFYVTKGISNLYTMVEGCLDTAGDHSPVIATISAKIIEKEKRDCLTNKCTDWNAFRTLIEDRINLNVKLKETKDIESAVKNLTNLIQEAAWKSTPTIKYNYNTNHNYSLETKAKILEKRRLRRVWQTSRLPCDKKALNKAAAELKSFLNMIDNTTLQYQLETLSPHRTDQHSLWKFTKNFNQPQVAIPPLRKADNSWAKRDDKKVEMYALFLQNVFTPNKGCSQEHWEQEVEEYLGSDLQMSVPIHHISPKELAREIKLLKLKKAPGFDLITAEILRELPKKAIIHLTTIFNSIIRLSYFPNLWKVSEILMIAKPGKPPNEVSSYRPISLLPTMSKLFEKLFNRRLQKIVTKEKLLPDHQFGFRSQHSTVEQLHRVCHKVRQSLENKEYCSAVFLDVQQAFDKVWHKGLLFKLKHTCPQNFFTLLKSYLEDRLFRVKLNDSYSKLIEIKAGVPQGSVLGPILYSLFTADIPETEGVLTATYADDTAVLSSNKNPEEASKNLQTHLNKIDVWLNKWKIKASAAKSKHITFTLKQGNASAVKLGSETLSHTDTVKYLGMYLDRKQTWRQHIQHKRNELNLKARNLDWLMNPRSRVSLENKLLIYKAVLKPVWSYGIELWGTASNSNIEIMQRFQNSILKKICGAPWFTKISDVHQYLHMQTIIQEIRDYNTRYHSRLKNHVNQLAVKLATDTNSSTRLKRHNILDLYKRSHK